MMIIGCDFHTRYQQIAMAREETSELLVERRLDHESGEAQAFYRSLAGGAQNADGVAGGNPQYYAEDFLGSSRVMTQNNGAVCYDADFDPFGSEHSYTNNCPSSNAYKFEGKERDSETGNDDFGARYYNSRFGRWLSADWSSVPVPVPYANLTNPQTLNLYAMVSDDPESFADLDGHATQASYGTSPETGSAPTCTAQGAGANGTTASGCGSNSSAQLAITTTWSALQNVSAQTLTVTKTDTTTATNTDGSVTTILNKTIVTFSTAQDHVGEVLNAVQHADMTRKAPDGTITTVAASSPFGEGITAGYAQQVFGDNNFKAAQTSAMPGRAEFFNRAVRNDHAGLLRAAGEVILLGTGVPEAYELTKAIGDVVLGAVDLAYGYREVRHPN
ncbi:MAG: RHS repeat-associated core domain-containing protein [Candidatus Acidiferrum sp.]